MDLLQDVKMPFLNFNFATIYVIHKMLVLLKNYLNYLKDSIFKCTFFNYFFSEHITMESVRLEEENIIKDIRNFLD